MSSSSGGSESTASMKEGAAETTPNMDPNASMTNGEHHHHHHNHHEEVPEEDPVPAQEPKEEEEEEEMESATEIKQQIQQSPENRMASVITINGSEAGCDHEVAYVEMNNGMGSGRSERSGFDNPAFVDDEARGKGSGGGKVVNGGGRLSPPSSPPPRPPSPAGPFLNSVVATTPPPPGGANGRGPIMETPNSNIHNNSGLIMTPSEKEKSDIDGCTNVTEAVNLELVNMNPYGGAGLGIGDEVAGGKSGTNGGLNGIPVKRGAGDEETGDGGFGDPYDEYFVPVNEHRKYMRGEKLYVTKDRRRSQSWRRCICWGVGFTLLAVAILIAVLAGTGVILSQEEDGKSVESRGFSDHIPHVAESRDPNAPVEKEPIPTDLPPEPSSSFTPPPSMSSVPVNPPTTEMSGLNVPRVLEADMRIDGLEFTSDLENSNSSRYKELASILGDELKLALFDDHTLRNGPADIFVKVVGFSPGSVVSKFHVGWRFKDSFPTARDPIDMESLKDRLEAYLLNHGGYLHTYRISSGSVTSTHVMDMCQIGNGGCSHECRYDYEEAKFMCNCPPGLFLEQTGKICTTELIDDTTSTKGPFFDESPWMPMQPKEPTPLDEVAKHDEVGRDAAGEETHGEEDKHGEMEDHDKMHEDHHSHVQPTDPAEDEDHNNMHEEHHTPFHPMHPIEAEMESEDSPVSGEEEHETNDSMNEGERKEMHEYERPVDEHHEERQLIPSVGTGRSSGDDMVLVEHSSEDPREEHDADNDTEHDEYSHFGREEEKHDEKSVESEEKHPSSREEMEKLGHSVDSSENTSEEVHDSAEVPHSREESDYDDVMGGRDMSEGGEVTNDYHSSVHSLSNELHGPISESTTSENPHYNGLESHESGDHEGSEVGEHVHASSTAAPDAHETFNETDHHTDGWPLKGEIISAVGHVIVKNENETAESTSHEQDESMEHNWESGVARENANESSHEMEEVVAHVVMDGEEMDNKGGDTAEHSSEEGMMDEKITEHKEEGMTDSAEDKTVDDMEKEVAAEPHDMETTEHMKDDMEKEVAVGPHDMETSEHMKDDMEKEVAVEPHDMKTPEHMKEEMPEDRGEDEMEHKDEGMKSSVMTVNSSGEGEHKEEVLMETKGENMATHEEVPEDKRDAVEDNVTSEGKDEREEGHVPVVVVMHGENDVGNHEENPKPLESHEVPAEGDGRENGREMDEKTKEKSQEEVMVHSTETTFGSDGHEMDLTAMNHEKPVMENNGSKENEHMDHNFGIPVVMMEHPVSEEKVTTETEASAAATGENEADIVNEKHNEKEESPWGMNNEAREVGEHAHSTEGQEMEAKEQVVPVVEKEVVMKDHEENTMMPEEKMKEMEDGTVVTDKISEHSMEKPSTEEESSTAKMEGPETISTHADNLTNVLEGNDEEGVKKVSEEEPKIESASAVPEEEMHKPDNHDVDDVSTPIPKAVILSEDEDPNIVPVEETPKETTDDDIDAKKSILPDMRIVGLDKGKDTETGMQNDTEMLMARENNEGSSIINLTSVSEGSNTSENHEGVSKMPMDHEMEVSMSSSTTSPAENSIENLSDHYNSTDGANITPSAENDHIEHLVVPVIVMNESSTVITTPSPKENNIDDPPLHLQAGIPMMASEEPSTSTTEQAIVNDLLPSGHDASASPKETTEKEGSADEKITELDRIEKVIDDMEEKLKEEVSKDEEHPSSMSTEATSEKSSEKEEKMMKEDKVDAEKVDVEVSGEKMTEGEGKEKSNSDSKEEMSSITTVHQDFTVEHANTVHAINPTSPSTTIEETPKEESMSDSTVPKTLESTDLEETATKDENRAPEPHLPFETDDNERSNNLATLDNEDSLTVPEGGNEAVVKVGAVDAGPKSTTEHTNEILAVPVYQSSWPSTALEANNLTKAQKDSEITPEGHQTESSALKEKEDVTKMGAFEIPMKKKGEFKKPTHQEDEITKPLFGKEGKESTNKVDKIGLLPVISTVREDSSEEMNSEEIDSLMVTTTEMSSVTQENMETGSGSSTEAGATLSTSPADKGGEKLNAIGEDDSGIKKDLGKAVVKETVKDVQESITMKSETTEKDASHENEEKSAIDSMLEPESTTQEMVDHKAVVMDERKDEAKEMKEDITTMSPKSDEVAEMLEVHPTEMVVKEEETTATSNGSSSPKKDDEEGMVKEMDEAVTVKEAAVGESEETMTKMSVAEETVVPTSTEAAREKVEELLKDMGGYGEGGHKVVSKSGVELADGHKEIHQERTTTEALNVVDTASSTSMASSTASSPTPSPPMTEAEKSSPTTLPPESETTKVEVNNEVEEKSTEEETSRNQMDGSKSENATSEDPIPTMMIHEIVPSISLSSTSLPVESPSSTASSVESVALPSKESEETTVVEEVPEITTINAVPEVAAVTTLSPDSVGVTMPPHVSEILMKDETSSFAGKDSVKEVASVNVSEPSLEKDKTEGSVTEKAAVEEDLGTSNATASAFPEIDQQYFSKCTAGQFQCANGTSLTPYSVTPISSSYVASLATGVACVPLSAKCDSINDCSDGSDELGCIEEGCPGNFQCSNGQCLKRHLVCNGIVDCNDASDEANCETWKCQFDEFQCPSGRCIPVLWQCDGKPDCDNHTDEYTCQDSCGNNEYLCPERWCIPMTWRCNGVPECANGEDEKLCDCSLEQVKCGTGGCVARSEICDGVDQCPDQSDEWGCVRLHNETMKLEVRTTENEWLSVCADNWDTSWSNFVCQSFGYSRAVFTEYPSAGDLDGSSEVFTLKPEASVTSPPGNSMRLPGVLQRVSPSVCSSGSIVEISCQEFTCGNHGLADGVAARLVGGDEAANGQWPSVALLYHTRQRATCTASIISPRWLIASYNCLHMREKLLTPEGWVAFGGGSTFDKDKPETQIRTVRSIVPYPQVKYNRFLYNHDVALVELVQPMTFTRSVGAICLPDKPIEPRQLCVTAGWGYTSPGEINFSQYLHYLPVPTIDLSECNSTKHYSGFITEDKICAGFTDAMHSPCYNDEGAPLMCVSEGGIWELQGVLSYHSNCGRGYHPSIFSSVTAVRDWVKRVVGGRFERRSTFNVRRRRRTKRRRNSDANERATSIIWT